MTILKNIFFKLPSKIQRVLGWRMRNLQTLSPRLCHRASFRKFGQFSTEEKKQWIFEQTRSITLHAQLNNPFYSWYYKEAGFDSATLRGFKDLKQIPIVTKEILRSSKKKWLQPKPGQDFGNTGGTSGSPLIFCMTKDQKNRESFYMSQIWQRIGCSPKHTRAVFRGRNLGNAPWTFYPPADAFFINTYRPLDEIASEINYFFNTHRVEFLHGYPSLLYYFANKCLKSEYKNLRQSVNRHLKGILLGSEYPAPHYREVIKKAFPVPSISWYGHSEMAVLAAENGSPYLYEPMHSYGFCEGVPLADGDTHLVGTSYDNWNSPFIRYDIGDSIEPIRVDEDLLFSFRIKNGRLGEFILDRTGHQISLTSLIFGRHHKAFENVEFIQISQDVPGHAVLHVTNRKPVSAKQVAEWFDLSNINMDFDINCREKPVRTERGKIPLLISERDVG